MKYATVAALFTLLATAAAMPAKNLAVRDDDIDTPDAPEWDDAIPDVDTNNDGIDDSDVQLCTGPNYTGECVAIEVADNQCQQLPQQFLRNLGSFRPEGGVLCRLTYTADTCTPHGDAFVYPDTGAPDLHNFVDANGQTVDAGSQATSFVCQECDTCAD
ncbi:hypothetical protein BS50DRAFT_583508 [Corynespora cassiicola Philippines]|uniref:Uncharacterized protein n=1 Tax=Corynespora cassiicola Philippines TaxID=1448308 RepID=A0A2T2P2H9_CORCC|nr:hypothetical protein BS50DRAFT_583508 [Corynespora cassiicola Philippines]